MQISYSSIFIIKISPTLWYFYLPCETPASTISADKTPQKEPRVNNPSVTSSNQGNDPNFAPSVDTQLPRPSGVTGCGDRLQPLGRPSAPDISISCSSRVTQGPKVLSW